MTAYVIGPIIFTVVVIVLSFAFRAKWSSGLMTGGMQNGTPGTGTIVGMGQTGTMINNQPVMTFEVMVQVPGQQPYQASVKQTIPMMAIGMLAPGRQVGVLVSPKDPRKVKLDLQATANLGAVAGMAGGGAVAGMPVAQTVSNADLLARGVRSWVTVLSVQDTGQFHEGDPLVLVGLHVHAADGEYQTTQNAYRVPGAVRARLVQGKQLQGAYDPANRQSVALDWATA